MARYNKLGYELAPRYQRFVDEYLIDLNGKQAAIRSGYAESSAATVACLLLNKNPDIKAAVRKGIAERAKRTRITADRVLKEYARIAFSDIRNFSEWGPEEVKLRPHTALSDDDAAAISEVSSRGVGPKSGSRLKLYDKRAALDALSKHLGLLDRKGSFSKRYDKPSLRRAKAILRERIAKLAGEEEEK